MEIAHYFFITICVASDSGEMEVNMKLSNELEVDKPIFDKWPYYDENEVIALKNVLESKRWGGIFDNSQNECFEREFADYNGSSYCMSVCNGTSALYIALIAAGIRAGDEVIVPSLSFISTATAVTWCGAVPVFVDVDPKTLCIDISSIVDAVSEKTRAIIPVHLWGNVCDMEKVSKIANQHNLIIIEDCCQAIGASLKDKKVGTYGIAGVFSFAFNKSASCGEGGALITNDYELYLKLSRLRNHGRLKSESNVHPHIGWNFRMSEFAAAILRCQLKRLEFQILMKNKNIEYIYKNIKENKIEWIEPIETIEESVSSPFGLIFKFIPTKSDFIHREEIIKLLKAKGIPIGERTVIQLQSNPIYANENIDDYCINRSICRRNGDIDVFVIGQPLGYEVLLAEKEKIDYLINSLIEVNKMIIENNSEMGGKNNGVCIGDM